MFQVSDDQDHILELLHYVSHPAETTARETNRPGNGHLAFIVEDAWSAFRELRDAGVEMVNEPAEVTMGINAGGKAFYFPRSRWIYARSDPAEAGPTSRIRKGSRSGTDPWGPPPFAVQRRCANVRPVFGSMERSLN